MESEVTESAKAIQEVAKATRTGIEATQLVGSFVSKIIDEPLEAVVGILTDRLQFVRAEGQFRLAERWREIMKSSKIEGVLRIVLPSSPYQLLKMLVWKKMTSSKAYGQIFLRPQ